MFRLVAGHLPVVVEKSNRYQQVLQEKEKSEALLLNVMPARIAACLRTGERTIAESFVDTCVLFPDLVSFTAFAGRYSPEIVVGILEKLFTELDRLCDAHGVEKIKTIGDG